MVCGAAALGLKRALYCCALAEGSLLLRVG
jgi:hypothetical protein